MPEWTVALAGNPNAGKSTIFNLLTGLRQHVGNWPGKTVEKKEGVCRHDGVTLKIVDLPGTYSLTAYSPEELIARNFIIAEHPDVVVNVVDATNLERNLYLTVQILEMGVPVVLALNMADDLDRQQMQIDAQALSEFLGGIPVVRTAANRGEGIRELRDQIAQAARERRAASFRVDYGREFEDEIARLEAAFDRNGFDPGRYTPRWLAVKLLEQDADVLAHVRLKPGGGQILALAADRAGYLQGFHGDDADLLAADRRYGFINGVVRQVLQRPLIDRLTLTERVDNVVTHKWLGLPVFFLVMYLMFRLVIDVSAPFLDWTDSLINEHIAGWISALLRWSAAPAWLHSLAVDGVVAGVGGVLVFVPGLLMLYFFLALLEDSGYMSRAAFVTDRFMRVVGLHGKSFIPMILGFGCAVPAVYATRTLSSRRDRILTTLLVPLMSCSARLPVYVVFGLAFFGSRAGTVIWTLYALGILVAMLAGMVFTRTLLKPDASSAFVLELPPYRQPSLKSVTIHMWENTREFVKKAGTVIFAFSIVMWLLLNLPWGVADQRQSYFGRVSSLAAPAFAPLGFGTWETAGSLVTGFIAKEIVVSTMSQIYLGEESPEADEGPAPFGEQVVDILAGFATAALDSGRILLSILPGVELVGEDDEPHSTALSLALQQRYSPLNALAFLVFVLLYVPCVATLGVIRQEFGTSWAVVSAVYQTSVAWLAGMLVYQGGRLLGLG
jgi:ferrous iron transport protein B